MTPQRPALRQQERLTLLCGDCRDVMAELPECGIDAIVSDPPYELGFMAKSWDARGVAFDPETWRAALRVLKPGGHLLAFGGPRTFHRLACAIEDAGFEVRDCLMWLFGSGFPKSHDVSKAIDKRPGVTAHQAFATHLAERRQAKQLSRADVSEAVVGSRSGACWNWEHHQFPIAKWWPALRDLLDLDSRWAEVIAEAERGVIGFNDRPPGWFTSQDGHSITAPATPEAARWQGWGTALAPAYEPIILARKPLKGTVASNVQKWGTGAINIDACRVQVTGQRPIGRWPKNLVLDTEAARLLDAMSGESGSTGTEVAGEAHPHGIYGHREKEGRGQIGLGDRGGASRFFYTAKASRSEREFGLDDLEPARRSDGREKDIENPRLRTNARRNDHPTVKPVDLMRWLVRLVTPPDGTVLDPFMGSGSTGMAVLDEGFNFVGIDMDEHYIEIARRRINRRALIEALPQPDQGQGVLL